MKKPVVIRITSAKTVRERMSYAWELVNRGLKAGEVIVTLGRPQKSRLQEAKYHAMIKDIQLSAYPDKDPEVVKALMVAEFAVEYKASTGKELTHPGSTVFSHKLQEWITIRPSTKKFRKEEGNAFIEYLYMVGADLDVRWSPETVKVTFDAIPEAA